MYQIAYNIELLTALLATFVLIFVRSRISTLLGAIVLYVILIDLFSKFAAIELPDGKKSNHYYFNLSKIPEIFFLIWIWSICMGERLKNKIAPFILSTSWLSFSIINLIFFQGFFVLNTATFLVASLILILLSAILLFVNVDEKSLKSLFKVPVIWFWTALLISNSFSFTYRVFEPYTNFSSQALFQYSIITAAIIKYLFISIAFIFMLQIRFSSKKNEEYNTSGT